MSRLDYFATCARGLEPLLADELAELQADGITPGRGGVAFRGDRRLLYAANLRLRTAVRVLQPVLHADVHSPDELYDAVKATDWTPHLTPDHTLAVDCNVRDSAITHSQYAARRVKDAICDQFRERTGRRPSVDAERPMLGLNLHLFRDRAVLSLDSSGDSLHKRGYRPVQTRAPLNEALAAAIVLRSGWRCDRALADPLCGGGTLCIEAAWIALDRPPGLTRKHFGFMGWMDFDRGEFAAIRDDLRRRVKPSLDHPVIGSDARHDAVDFATTNAKAAGVGHAVSFQQCDLKDWRPPPGAGTLLCNPPYGERIGEEDELRPLYKLLGDVFRSKCPGWDVWVFTGNQTLSRLIGLSPVESVPLFNGKIPCKLHRFKP